MSNATTNGTFTERIAFELAGRFGVHADPHHATILDTDTKRVVSIEQEDPEGGCEVFVRVPESYAVEFDMRFGTGTPVEVVVNAIRVAMRPAIEQDAVTRYGFVRIANGIECTSCGNTFARADGSVMRGHGKRCPVNPRTFAVPARANA